jgi:hypothetical protein
VNDVLEPGDDAVGHPTNMLDVCPINQVAAELVFEFIGLEDLGFAVIFDPNIQSKVGIFDLI